MPERGEGHRRKHSIQPSSLQFLSPALLLTHDVEESGGITTVTAKRFESKQRPPPASFSDRFPQGSAPQAILYVSRQKLKRKRPNTEGSPPPLPHLNPQEQRLGEHVSQEATPWSPPVATPWSPPVATPWSPPVKRARPSVGFKEKDRPTQPPPHLSPPPVNPFSSPSRFSYAPSPLSAPGGGHLPFIHSPAPSYASSIVQPFLAQAQEKEETDWWELFKVEIENK